LGPCRPLTVDPQHRARLEGLFGSKPLAQLLGFELAEVSRDADPGELVASFQAMVYRTDRWHLGPEEWTDEWKATH
jgi:hypothetical protein